MICSHDNDTSVKPQLEKGYYEPHVQKLIFNFCNGGNILDIGANYGQHTIFMSKLFPNSNITAIEASAGNIEILKESIDFNSCTNINIIQAFLSDYEKEIEYCYWPELSACAFGCTTDYAEVQHKEYKTIVKTQKLDDIIDFEPDFIKMDIEGAEFDTLHGGVRTFSKCPPLMLELNNFTSTEFYDRHVSELIKKLIEIGYNLAYINHNGNIVKVFLSQLIDITLQPKFVMIDALFTKEDT